MTETLRCSACNHYVRGTVEYGPARYGQQDIAIVRFEPHFVGPADICGGANRGHVLAREAINALRPPDGAP